MTRILKDVGLPVVYATIFVMGLLVFLSYAAQEIEDEAIKKAMENFQTQCDCGQNK